TTYTYNSAGALNKTVTKDAGGIKLQETSYAGLQNQEKASLATSFDKQGTILTKTTYTYNSAGALIKTVTTDSGNIKIQETTYTGLQNQEKASVATSFDKQGTILTKTTYTYNSAGALIKTVTTDSGNIKLQETTYTGLQNQEKASLATSFDKQANILTKTTYTYNSAGALTKTVTEDAGSVKLQDTTYEGLSNRERRVQTITYEDDGSVFQYITYEYDSATGTLSKSITRDSGNKLVSETIFTGLSGQEKTNLTKVYDSDGIKIKNFIHYEYRENGAIWKTVKKKSDDSTLLSEDYYTGLMGFEIVDFTINYKDDGSIKSSIYYYYGTERANSAFREDALSKAESYEGGNLNGNTAGLILESVAYYKGEKGKEVVEFSQRYGYKPDDNSVRELQATTICEYDNKRALSTAYTYFGGNEGSKEVGNLKQDFMTEYTGKRGEEQVTRMEGTTCQYPVDDIKEWNYYIRTDFSYDSEGRNTGYIEEIYSPQGEWEWGKNIASTQVKVRKTEFSDFDSEDRYGEIKNSVLAWNSATGQYEPTGEIEIENNFKYDVDGNVTSCMQTYIKPGEETQRQEKTFSDYDKGKAQTITTWELNADYIRTGHYSEQSSIIYDQYGRITDYTLTTFANGKTKITYVFDIIYDKDKIIEDKVRQHGELINFGPNYSVRQYKYNSVGEAETVVIKNGDYISVYNKDNENIYFEYTPAMEALKGQGTTVEEEPAEGAGPRDGSHIPVNPIVDILEEARNAASHKDINPDGNTQILYNGENQVVKITDAKGNVFVYSENKLTELRNSGDTLVASFSYQTNVDDELTVSMTNALDGSTASFKYDSDSRRLLIEVFNSAAERTRFERYTYTKRQDGTVESATVLKKFRRDGKYLVTDRKEEYDAQERVIKITTTFQRDGIPLFVGTWPNTRKDRVIIFVEEWSATYDSEGNFTAVYTDCERDGIRTIERWYPSLESWCTVYDPAYHQPGIDFKETLKYEDGTLFWRSSFTAERRDGKDNILEYHQVIYESGLVTTIDWEGTYENGALKGFTETLNRKSSQLDVTEITERSAMEYDSGKLVSYNETFTTTAAPYKTVEKTVEDITYENGRIVGYKETNHAFASAYKTFTQGLDRTTSTRRSNMGYDLHGRLIYWEDVFLNHSTNTLSNIVTSDVVYDKYGNILTFKEVKTGYVQLSPPPGLVQWQEITTERLETTYNGKMLVSHMKDIVTIKLNDGSIKETKTIEKNGITHDSLGREYSYTQIINGESTRVDSSIYNRIGQLSEQHTKIDEYTDNIVYFEYDKAGELLKSGYYVYYHKEWSEKEDYTTHSYTQHYEGTTWYDKYNNKIEEVVEDEYLRDDYVYHKEWSEKQGKDTVQIVQHEEGTTWYDTEDGEMIENEINVEKSYVDIHVKESFWSKDWGRAITTVGGIALNCVPGVGWMLSLTYNTMLSLADDTFSWSSVAGTMVVRGLDRFGVFDDVFDSLGLGKIFGDVAASAGKEMAFSETFIYSLKMEILQKAISEGMVEIAKNNKWNTFWTAVAASFASSTVGYVYRSWKHSEQGRYGFVKVLCISALKGAAAGGIAEYMEAHEVGVHEKPSHWSWAEFMEPIVEEAVRNLSGRSFDKYALEKGSRTKRPWEGGTWKAMKVIAKFFRGLSGKDRPENKSIDKTKEKTDALLNKENKSAGQNQSLELTAKPPVFNFINNPDNLELLKPLPSADNIRQEGDFLLNDADEKGVYDIEEIKEKGDVFLNKEGQPFWSEEPLTGKGTDRLLLASIDTEWLPYSGVFDIDEMAYRELSLMDTLDRGQEYLFLRDTKAVGIGSEDIEKAAMEMFAEEFKSLSTLTEFVKIGEIPVTSLSGLVADIAEFAKVQTVDVLVSLADNEIYYRFGLSSAEKNVLDGVMHKLASPYGRQTYDANLKLSEQNQSLEIMMTKDGEKSYLLGDVGYNELKGEAQKWAERAGRPDNIEFELNFKTGDLFMFVEVKKENIAGFFKQEHEDIAKLEETITDNISSVDKLKSLEFSVVINEDKNVNKIVGATVIVNPNDMEDKAAVSEYLNTKFEGALGAEQFGLFDIVFDIGLELNEVEIQALSINLEAETNEDTMKNIRALVKNLEKGSAKLRKLGGEIKELVKSANNKPQSFERINLVVNEKGDYQIRVKIKSGTLKTLPSLMAKLGITGNSNAYDRLSKRKFTEFVIDVNSGRYMLDLSLKCQKFEKAARDEAKAWVEGNRDRERKYDKELRKQLELDDSLRGVYEKPWQSPDGQLKGVEIWKDNERIGIVGIDGWENITLIHYGGDKWLYKENWETGEEIIASVKKEYPGIRNVIFNEATGEITGDIINVSPTHFGAWKFFGRGKSYERPSSYGVTIDFYGQMRINGTERVEIAGETRKGIVLFEIDNLENKLMILNDSIIKPGKNNELIVLEGEGFVGKGMVFDTGKKVIKISKSRAPPLGAGAGKESKESQARQHIIYASKEKDGTVLLTEGSFFAIQNNKAIFQSGDIIINSGKESIGLRNVILWSRPSLDAGQVGIALGDSFYVPQNDTAQREFKKAISDRKMLVADKALYILKNRDFTFENSKEELETAKVQVEVWGFTAEGQIVGIITGSDKTLWQADGAPGEGTDIPEHLVSRNLILAREGKGTSIQIGRNGALVIVGPTLMPSAANSQNITLKAGYEVQGQRIMKDTIVNVDKEGKIQFREGARVEIIVTGFKVTYTKENIKGKEILIPKLDANQAPRNVTLHITGTEDSIKVRMYVNENNELLFTAKQEINYNNHTLKAGNEGKTLMAEELLYPLSNRDFTFENSKGKLETAKVEMEVWGFTAGEGLIGRITFSDRNLFQLRGEPGKGFGLPEGLISEGLALTERENGTEIKLRKNGSGSAVVFVGNNLMPLAEGSKDIMLAAGWDLGGTKLKHDTIVDVDSDGKISIQKETSKLLLNDVWQALGKNSGKRLINIRKALETNEDVPKYVTPDIAEAILAADSAAFENADTCWKAFADSTLGKPQAKNFRQELKAFIKAEIIALPAKKSGIDLTRQEEGLNCVGLHVLASQTAGYFGMQWDIVFVNGLKTGHVALIDAEDNSFIELSIRGDVTKTLAKRYEDSLAKGKAFKDVTVVLVGEENGKLSIQEIPLEQGWDGYGKFQDKYEAEAKNLYGFSAGKVLDFETLKRGIYHHVSERFDKVISLLQAGDTNAARSLLPDVREGLDKIADATVLEKIAGDSIDSLMPGFSEFNANLASMKKMAAFIDNFDVDQLTITTDGQIQLTAKAGEAITMRYTPPTREEANRLASEYENMLSVLGARNIQVNVDIKNGEWVCRIQADIADQKKLGALIGERKYTLAGHIDIIIGSQGIAMLAADMTIKGADKGAKEEVTLLADKSIIAFDPTGVIDIISAKAHVIKAYTEKIDIVKNKPGEDVTDKEEAMIINVEHDRHGTYLSDGDIMIQNNRFIASEGQAFIFGESFAKSDKTFKIGDNIVSARKGAMVIKDAEGNSSTLNAGQAAILMEGALFSIEKNKVTADEGTLSKGTKLKAKGASVTITKDYTLRAKWDEKRAEIGKLTTAAGEIPIIGAYRNPDTGNIILIAEGRQKIQAGGGKPSEKKVDNCKYTEYTILGYDSKIDTFDITGTLEWSVDVKTAALSHMAFNAGANGLLAGTFKGEVIILGNVLEANDIFTITKDGLKVKNRSNVDIIIDTLVVNEKSKA
ncbi:MAG: hypothetical protein JSV93_04645, partial [Candidatus Omnitrophota bacterium]